MRILHVIRTLDPAWGGPVEAVRSLAKEGETRGHADEVVCVDAVDAPWLSTWTVPVAAVGHSPSTYGRSKQLDTWLDQNLRRFDAVIVHGIWMYFSYAVWKAQRRHKVPYFLFIHGALDPWFRRKYPLKHLKKAIYWKAFEWRVVRDAAAVLFTTEEEMSLAKEGGFSPYECKPAVVGFGIPPLPLQVSFDKEQARRGLTAQFPKLANRPFLLLLSRIHEKKGIDLLLRSFAASRRLLPGTALVIAGPGETGYREALEKLGEELKIGDDVVWTGPLYGDAKLMALRAADAYALPSHQENFGISVVEALCCGTPVLISDKVNIWREVAAESAGLVETDDVEGTTRLLQRWATLEAGVKANMRVNAERCYASHFNISSVSNKLFALLQG